MSQFWKSLGTPNRGTARDIRTLSLHVLSGAGFGKLYSFQKSAEPPKPGHLFNYRDSLAMVLENSLLILVLGPKFLTSWFLPTSWSRIGQTTVDFKFHMIEMVNEEKRLIAQKKPEGRNFISSLIRESQEEMSKSSADADTGGTRIPGLTEDEIYGNIFVHDFGGHDTMAITLNWALYLLVAHAELQSWISEEIDAVIIGDHSATWHYTEIYPRLNRYLAVLVSNSFYLSPLHLSKPGNCMRNKISTDHQFTYSSLKLFAFGTPSLASPNPPELFHKTSRLTASRSPFLHTAA